MPKLLTVANIDVAYGNISAIRGMSMEVGEREVVALIGANGSGKSTLVKSIAGSMRPLTGNIWFDGEDMLPLPPYERLRRGVSLVPEGRGILATLTVYENLALGAYLRKDKSSVRKDLEEMMARFPILGERRNQKADHLSGGEQQLLSIARGLMSRPKLLMLDEPSWGLAPLMVAEVFNIIRDVSAGGCTILLSEQNALKALQCADRAYVLETGSIVLSGAASDLLHDGRIRQAYLGTG